MGAYAPPHNSAAAIVVHDRAGAPSKVSGNVLMKAFTVQVIFSNFLFSPLHAHLKSFFLGFVFAS